MSNFEEFQKIGPENFRGVEGGGEENDVTLYSLQVEEIIESMKHSSTKEEVATESNRLKHSSTNEEVEPINKKNEHPMTTGTEERIYKKWNKKKNRNYERNN